MFFFFFERPKKILLLLDHMQDVCEIGMNRKLVFVTCKFIFQDHKSNPDQINELVTKGYL